MKLEPWLVWLQETALGTAVRENGVLFPWIESLHVLAVVTVLGGVAVIDWRLLGLAWAGRPVTNVLSDVFSCIWGAFAIAAVTGFLLFTSNATVYAHNAYFQAKVVLLAAVGVNAFVFHRVVADGIGAWDAQARTPWPARASGAVSIALWIAITVCGRWVGFTLITRE